jgi:hypothetical protein
MQKALAPEISTWPDEDPQLIGSRCDACGATTFPVQQRCPRCSTHEMSQVLLPVAAPWSLGRRRASRRGRPTRGRPVELGMAVELTIIPFKPV